MCIRDSGDIGQPRGDYDLTADAIRQIYAGSGALFWDQEQRQALIPAYGYSEMCIRDSVWGAWIEILCGPCWGNRPSVPPYVRRRAPYGARGLKSVGAYGKL